MVRMTGSVRGENSLTAPSGELFSSVVRRSSGKRAKRMSGTESRAPTTVEPTPSNVPRKERLFSRDNAGAAGFSVVASESPAHAHIKFSLDYEWQEAQRPSGFCFERRRTSKICYFFFGNARMYATSDSITSAESFCPKAGIFPVPLAMTSASSASDFACTSGDLKSLAFRALPEAVSPLPSAAWHSAQLVLYTLATSLSALRQAGRARIARQIKMLSGATVRKIRRMCSPLLDSLGSAENHRKCVRSPDLSACVSIRRQTFRAGRRRYSLPHCAPSHRNLFPRH